MSFAQGSARGQRRQLLVNVLSLLAPPNRLWNFKVVRIFETERDRPMVREGFDYR
jgi:hypothetical protein